MELAGVLLFGDSQIKYYSENHHTFFTDNRRRNLMGEEYLRELALWVNSPQNQESQGYTIVRNAQGSWVCKYSVESVGSVKTVLYGYGASEMDALNQCRSILTYLQEKYNAENDAIKE